MYSALSRYGALLALRPRDSTPMSDLQTAPSSGEWRSYVFDKKLEAVREAVSLERYARSLTELKPEGQHLVGLCPLHQEKTPSFKIHRERSFWYCFGACQEGGDVFDLAMGIERCGFPEAVHMLAEHFSVEYFARPDKWFTWENEKGRRRKAIRDKLAESYRRRYFNTFCAEYLSEIEDDADRWKEAQHLWDWLYPPALSCAEQRVSR